MKITAMQPYFFPYLGYYQLIESSDIFIILDEVQFIDKGWINRNRVLHPAIEKKWNYINVPLSDRKQFSKIKDVRIDNSKNWKSTILGKISHYQSWAPNYYFIKELLENYFENDFDKINKLCEFTIRSICSLLNVKTQIFLFSDLDLNLPKISNPGEWALFITKSLGGKEYINPVNGKNLFKKEDFQKHDINLKFLEYNDFAYSQNNRKFESKLSILDMLLCNKNFKNDTSFLKSKIIEA